MLGSLPMSESMSVKLRRRSFLAYFGSAGPGSTLFPGALWAQSGGQSGSITSDMMTAAKTCQDANDFHLSYPNLD